MVDYAIVGAGVRGASYAEWIARHPGHARVVAVAEPLASRRDRIPCEHTFTSWQELAAAPRVADAVIVSTQDAEHVGPVTALARKGYHVLVEKPLAPSPVDCEHIVDAVTEAGVLFAVGHVLRYRPYTRLVKRLVDEGRLGDVVSVLTDDLTEEGVTTALREGPYGRCVYACDNDVVDHQVVAMEFEGGASGTFTMTAFTPQEDRRTRIFGTRGCLVGDGTTVRLHDFLTRTTEVVEVPASGIDAEEGHAGGDDGLMDAFTTAVATGDPSHILSGPAESLESHLAVFAAERARRSGTVEEVRGRTGGPSRRPPAVPARREPPG